jgi:hypothetical protein
MSQIKDIDGRDKPGHQPVDGSRPTTIGIILGFERAVHAITVCDDRQ